MKFQDSDVLQAVLAALMFGEDAGLAAVNSGNGWPLNVGGGCMVHLTPAAKSILAEAQGIVASVEADRYAGSYDYYIDSEVSEHLWATRMEA